VVIPPLYGHHSSFVSFNFVTTENVRVNVLEFAHVEPLSEIYTLQDTQCLLCPYFEMSPLHSENIVGGGGMETAKETPAITIEEHRTQPLY
jgi:hypothetical protein